ncbi:MAG: hypothetical protein ACFFAN_16000, partial [Promethearchaeota archaeon]
MEKEILDEYGFLRRPREGTKEKAVLRIYLEIDGKPTICDYIDIDILKTAKEELDEKEFNELVNKGWLRPICCSS